MERVVMYKDADGALGRQKVRGVIHRLAQTSERIPRRTSLVRLTVATTGSGMDRLTHLGRISFNASGRSFAIP